MALNPDQQKVMNYIKENYISNKSANIIMLGSAGTGKSFLLKHIIDFLNNQKNIIALSFSYQAIAASIINGITLHKLFSFKGNKNDKAVIYLGSHIIKFEKSNDGEYIKVYSGKNNYETDKRKILSYNPIKNWLIIDEISNISIELINDMDSILKLAFGNNKVFGGVNIIFSGDLYQLKPISGNPVYSSFIPDDHFIKSFKLFNLTLNQRQSDKVFSNLCEAVKYNCLDENQMDLLKERLIDTLMKKNKNLDVSNLIHIFPTKINCNEYNMNKLKELNNTIYVIEAIDNNIGSIHLNKNDIDCFQGIHKTISIAEKAKVMITVNFQNYCNGEIGIIEKIETCNSKVVNILLYLEKKNIKINIPLVERNIVSKDNKVLFSRTGFPLQLSWAITTHKMQGITLEEAVIYMGNENFDPVQTYINISRIKNYDGLYIKDLTNIKTNKDIKYIREFEKQLINNNKQELNNDFDRLSIIF